jgi:hypothetical protein
MADPFPSQAPSLIGPIENGFSVTPSDGSDQPQVSRAIWVGGAGNLSVVTRGGDTITFVGVPSGTLIPIRAKRIRSTGTTATSIVALY